MENKPECFISYTTYNGQNQGYTDWDDMIETGCCRKSVLESELKKWIEVGGTTCPLCKSPIFICYICKKEIGDENVVAITAAKWSHSYCD